MAAEKSFRSQNPDENIFLVKDVDEKFNLVNYGKFQRYFVTHSKFNNS